METTKAGRGGGGDVVSTTGSPGIPPSEPGYPPVNQECPYKILPGTAYLGGIFTKFSNGS